MKYYENDEVLEEIYKISTEIEDNSKQNLELITEIAVLRYSIKRLYSLRDETIQLRDDIDSLGISFEDLETHIDVTDYLSRYIDNYNDVIYQNILNLNTNTLIKVLLDMRITPTSVMIENKLIKNSQPTYLDYLDTTSKYISFTIEELFIIKTILDNVKVIDNEILSPKMCLKLIAQSLYLEFERYSEDKNSNE